MSSSTAIKCAWKFRVSEISAIVGRHCKQKAFTAKSKWVARERPWWLDVATTPKTPQALIDLSALAACRVTSAASLNLTSAYWLQRKKNMEMGKKMERLGLAKYSRQTGESITREQPTLEMVFKTAGLGVPYKIVGRADAYDSGPFVLELKTRAPETGYHFPEYDKDQLAMYALMSRLDARLVQQKQQHVRITDTVMVADMTFEACAYRWKVYIKPGLDNFVDELVKIEGHLVSSLPAK